MTKSAFVLEQVVKSKFSPTKKGTLVAASFHLSGCTTYHAKGKEDYYLTEAETVLVNGKSPKKKDYEVSSLLGKQVEDTVSGCKGTATVYSTSILRADYIAIQAKAISPEDGLPVSGYVCDLSYVEEIKDGKTISHKVGGSMHVKERELF